MGEGRGMRTCKPNKPLGGWGRHRWAEDQASRVTSGYKLRLWFESLALPLAHLHF